VGALAAPDFLVMLGIIMDQPTPKISRKDIMRIVARDYPARKQEEVLEILRQYDGDSEKGKFRVWASLMKISEGEIEQLRENVERAKSDFRDILAYAEYPEYSDKVGFDDENFTKTELKDIIKADWKQYQNWLKAK